MLIVLPTLNIALIAQPFRRALFLSNVVLIKSRLHWSDPGVRLKSLFCLPRLTAGTWRQRASFYTLASHPPSNCSINTQKIPAESLPWIVINSI